MGRPYALLGGVAFGSRPGHNGENRGKPLRVQFPLGKAPCGKVIVKRWTMPGARRKERAACTPERWPGPSFQRSVKR